MLWRFLSLLFVSMENVDMARCQGHVEEPPAPASGSNFDLPKLPVDLAKLTTDRIETVPFYIHKYGKNLRAI